MKTKQGRESGIELLRIMAALGVILLHFNHAGAGGGFSYVQDGSINKMLLYYLNSISVCAVDIFVIMSGYYLCVTSKRTMIKPIRLFVEFVFIRTIGYIFNATYYDVPIALEDLAYNAIPANYYLVLYSTLYIISPYINLMIEKMEHEQRKRSVVFLGLIFSVWPTTVDFLQELMAREFKGLSTIGLYGSQWGYSIVNFVLLYLIGAYIRLNKVEKDWKILSCIIMVVPIILTGWSLLNDTLVLMPEKSAWEYCNPLVIIEAVAIFMLFKKMHFTSKIINSLATASYTSFLVHSYLVGKVRNEYIVQQNLFAMIFYIVIVVSGIYMVAWIINKIYSYIAEPVFKCIENFVHKTELTN